MEMYPPMEYTYHQNVYSAIIHNSVAFIFIKVQTKLITPKPMHRKHITHEYLLIILLNMQILKMFQIHHGKLKESYTLNTRQKVKNWHYSSP
jgi:hypothetical protein